MENFGQRLRRRARELGLSDSEVARRLGMQQSRYAHYVSGTREPDLATLSRICRLLGTSPNALLGFSDDRKGARPTALQRIEAAVEAMTPEARLLAADLLDTLARQRAAEPGHAPRKPSGSRRKPIAKPPPK